MPKFSKNNPQSHSVDFMSRDGAGQKLATPQQILKSIDCNNEELRERGLSLCGIYDAVAPWEEIKKTIMARAASKITELKKDRLVDVVPLDLETHPVFLDMHNAIVAFQMGGGSGGVELQTLVLSGVVFQIEQQAIGENEEIRLDLGQGQWGVEKFNKLWASGHPQAKVELQELEKSERGKRLAWEKAVAALPKPVDPQDRLAAGIAQGVAAALVSLGVAKPATGKAL